jgi:uncharacterized protein YbaR (Trm112 family)
MSSLNPDLLKVLACPACDDRPAVEPVDDGAFLQCTSCKRKYPVKEGIPVMLIDEAIVDGQD